MPLLSLCFRVPWVSEIAVSVAECYKKDMEAIINTFDHQLVKLVTAGTTRHRSIANGVHSLGKQNSYSC